MCLAAAAPGAPPWAAWRGGVPRGGEAVSGRLGALGRRGVAWRGDAERRRSLPAPGPGTRAAAASRGTRRPRPAEASRAEPNRTGPPPGAGRRGKRHLPLPRVSAGPFAGAGRAVRPLQRCPPAGCGGRREWGGASAKPGEPQHRGSGDPRGFRRPGPSAGESGAAQPRLGQLRGAGLQPAGTLSAERERRAEEP